MKLLTAKEALIAINEREFSYANTIVNFCINGMISCASYRESYPVGASINPKSTINAERACKIARNLGYTARWEKIFDQNMKFEVIVFFMRIDEVKNEIEGAMPLELVDRSRQLIKESYQKEIDELKRKLEVAKEVMRCAYDLSVRHPEFCLAAMEPFEKALKELENG